jgi:hypothetical protein
MEPRRIPLTDSARDARGAAEEARGALAQARWARDPSDLGPLLAEGGGEE